jgi:hypothetical protein
VSEMYAPPALHMTWCQDVHSRDDGACLVEVGVEDLDSSALLSLVGVHCDHQRLRLAGDVTTVEGIDGLIHMLGRLRTDMAAAWADLDCDSHPQLHPVEVDEDLDDDVPCDGCGTTTENMLLLSDGPPEIWLCRPCCEAQGIPYDPRG